MCHSVVFSIFPVLGNYHYHLITNHCPHPKQKSHTHSPLSSNPWQPLIYSLSLWICRSRTCAQMESCNTWPVCCFWAFTHLATRTSAPLLSVADRAPISWWVFVLFLLSGYYEYCYAFLCTSFYVDIGFQFSWCETVRSYSNSTLNFLRNYRTVVHSSRTTFCPHQQCTRAPFLHVLKAGYCLFSWL